MRRFLAAGIGLVGILGCWACSSSSDSGGSLSDQSDAGNANDASAPTGDAGSTTKGDGGASSKDGGLTTDDGGPLVTNAAWGTVVGTSEGACAVQSSGVICWQEPFEFTPNSGIYAADGLTGLSKLSVWSSSPVFPADGGAYQEALQYCGVQASDTTSVVCNDTSLNRTIPNLKFLAAGYAAFYAIETDGTLVDWGNDTGGELGNGFANPVDLFTVPLSGKVIDVAGTAAGACALLESGEVDCWDQDLNPDETITKMDFGGPVTALSRQSGSPTVCAILATGTVRCIGQIGLWSTGKSVDLAHLAGAISVAVTGSQQACGLMSDGSVKCIDQSTAAADPTLPEPMIELHAGQAFVARGASGAVYRWSTQPATKILP